LKYSVKFLILAIEDKKEIKKRIEIIRILRASWDLPKYL